jgi:hypothetical protein
MRSLWVIWPAVVLFTACPALANERLQPTNTFCGASPQSSQIRTIIVDLQSGAGWSCVFNFSGPTGNWQFQGSFCHRLGSNIPAGNYLAQGSAQTSTPAFPGFVLVEQNTRTATGCIIPGYAGNPALTSCGSAKLN